MSIIDLARQIGVAIQSDETYIKSRAAEQTLESDNELQNLIKEFNMIKMSINNEMSKEGFSEEKIAKLNKDLKDIYEKIMSNEKMENYNTCKAELDKILMRVNAIIMQSAQGENPMTTDYHESCGGSCSTCGGCH